MTYRVKKISFIYQFLKNLKNIPGRLPPLIPISMIGIERIEDIEKKNFIQKHFLSPIYFDSIS